MPGLELKLISSNKMFNGWQKVFSHYSKELSCQMKFSIYLPPQTENGTKVSVLYWLSGLTCTEANFVEKAGAQQHAAKHGIIIVCPDTSPRNVDIPGQDDSWDFGTGAGFYVDATTNLWKNHYRMYSYVTSELISLIQENFPAKPDVQSICGHSMGGHGALICALKNPGLYKSVSAFAPISNPMECQWGKKAFQGYLGDDTEHWKDWDATHLVKKYNGPPLELNIFQGSDDEFLKGQLLPENLVQACRDSQMPCVLDMKEDYNHSYYFIATFIGDHINYHAKFLN